MQQEKVKTGKSFINVSIVIFFSKLLGFCRDVYFASVFGTTVLTDIFQIIFSYPSLLFASVGNAISAVNIPDLTHFTKKRTIEERNEYLSSLLTYISLLATILSLLGIILAPYVTRLIAPGLGDDVNHIAITLTKIMMPTLLFVCLTFITAGVLQVHGYFVLSSTISIPFNIIIMLALYFSGNNIYVLGYFTTIGWLMQFLIQVPVLFKEKYRLRFRLSIKDKYINNTLKNLVPILMGNSLLHLCLIIDRGFASHLPEGTAAALGFGSNLFITITSIFIVAMSTVIFPRLSQFCQEASFGMVTKMLTQSFKILLFILIPYLLLVIIYHQEIIALVYQRGAFGDESTSITSIAFLFYSLAVIGYACQELYNRVFYALKNFKTPMFASLTCLLINCGFDAVFFKQYGIMALTLSTSASLLLYAVIMSFLLTNSIGSFLNRDLLKYCTKLLIPISTMIAIIWAGRELLPGDNLLTGLIIPVVFSSSAYLLAAYFCGFHRVFLTKEI